MASSHHKYSISKARKICAHIYKQYKKKKNRIDPKQQKQFEEDLVKLQKAVLEKDKEKAHIIAKDLENLSKTHIVSTKMEKVINFILSAAFALTVAIGVRQMWFENYTIPTGSMRPTFKERDFLIVSKTTFGINTPTSTGNIYFNKDAIKRGDTIIFSGKDMDIPDVDTLYFYLIPGKKVFIKRLIGKPGDTLYFYGGHIYGIDENDHEIKDFYHGSWFQDLEHIPFINFSKTVKTPKRSPFGIFSPAVFYQMNEPIAKLTYENPKQIDGELLPSASNIFVSHNDYYDLWGMKNFAMTILLTKSQMEDLSSFNSKNLPDAPLYLYMTHHPSIHNTKLITDAYGRLRPELSYSYSAMPIDEDHLKILFNNLYTSRFTVKNEIATPFDRRSIPKHLQVKLENVPDGTYEFYFGKAYKVYSLGVTKLLPKSHPIYDFSIKRVQTLYNFGLDFIHLYSPLYRPSRYAYFREGDFYLMGAKIFEKNDSIIENFIDFEKKQSYQNSHHIPFTDTLPPFKEDGSLNKDFIKQHGIKIPNKMYLALGDNHAMSGDSREFGFVPEENLRGSAAFVYWPINKRAGLPAQPSHPLFTFPNITIWIIAIAIFVGFSIYFKKRFAKPMKF
ncbi:MAG TPA: signal peptidase I [Chlamydiales bacterium]|nr:signal peptidase I [Chlamydiales bacterium]